jgi:hypothetical protein
MDANSAITFINNAVRGKEYSVAGESVVSEEETVQDTSPSVQPSGAGVGGSSSSALAGKVKTQVARLTIGDPSAAKGSAAFRAILSMGKDAFPILKQMVLNNEVSTDPLKWAAYLAAVTAPTSAEARAFVARVEGGGYPDYVVTEAQNGENARGSDNVSRQGTTVSAASSALAGKVKAQVALLTMGDPSAAERNPAFKAILDMGKDAFPELRQMVFNNEVSTDPLKWAAHLAAITAPTTAEARAFVARVEDGGYPDYVVIEAQRGEAARSSYNVFRQGASVSAASSALAGKVKTQVARLTIGDPSAAKGSAAFRAILSMGKDAFPVLKQMVLNNEVSTDPLKWAAYLAAVTAPTSAEARAFVARVEGGGYPDYVVIEARNGLKARGDMAESMDRSTRNDQLGGIDFEKIDLNIDAANGAVSFEVNDAVVAALQERLFGLEPVSISSVPLVDLKGFLGIR